MKPNKKKDGCSVPDEIAQQIIEFYEIDKNTPPQQIAVYAAKVEQEFYDLSQHLILKLNPGITPQEVQQIRQKIVEKLYKTVWETIHPDRTYLLLDDLKKFSQEIILDKNSPEG